MHLSILSLRKYKSVCIVPLSQTHPTTLGGERPSDRRGNEKAVFRKSRPVTIPSPPTTLVIYVAGSARCAIAPPRIRCQQVAFIGATELPASSSSKLDRDCQFRLLFIVPSVLLLRFIIEDKVSLLRRSDVTRLKRSRSAADRRAITPSHHHQINTLLNIACFSKHPHFNLPPFIHHILTKILYFTTITP